MSKITRVRTGCWTCKKRHRKCDEQKPHCKNCLSTGRSCEGYGIRLCFDVDDSRNGERVDGKGKFMHGFVGRPRANRKADRVEKHPKRTDSGVSQPNPGIRHNSLTGEALQHNNHSGLMEHNFQKPPMGVLKHESAPNLNEVINASSIDMEVLPKNGSSSVPHSKIPGANFEDFGTELFEGLEFLLKSPNASSAMISTPRRNSQNINFILDAPPTANGIDESIPITEAGRTSQARGQFSHPSQRDSFNFDGSSNRITSLSGSAFQNDNESIHSSSMSPSISSGTQIFDRNYPVSSASTEDCSLSYEEENMMLKHFFKNLLPLLDAHPNSPWPDLALKYCDFDIARSCFISLACIHIYESRKGGQEYYKKGMVHINSTMDYLIQFISSSNTDDQNNSKDEGHSLSKIDGETTSHPSHSGDKDANDSLLQSINSSTPTTTKKKMISSFVILVLINVHILFAVLEKGLSSFSRFFFKVFASVCSDEMFYSSLLENAKKQSLAVVLSWYDTVSAIVSPDCRLPYCNPDWYGSSINNIDKVSTAKMMGCPGEIFRAMSKVCSIRNELYKGSKIDRKDLLKKYEEIKFEVLQYRDYVLFGKSGDIDEELLEGGEYSIRLKAAQCWALAVYMILIKTVQPTPLYQKNISALLHEFIDVYGSMKSSLPFVTQMVWPVFAMGCECSTDWEKSKLELYMDTLYQNAQMGTLFTLKQIVLRVWETGVAPEEVVKSYLDEGIDYLPL